MADETDAPSVPTEAAAVMSGGDEPPADVPPANRPGGPAHFEPERLGADPERDQRRAEPGGAAARRRHKTSTELDDALP